MWWAFRWPAMSHCSFILFVSCTTDPTHHMLEAHCFQNRSCFGRTGSLVGCCRTGSQVDRCCTDWGVCRSHLRADRTGSQVEYRRIDWQVCHTRFWAGHMGSQARGSCSAVDRSDCHNRHHLDYCNWDRYCCCCYCSTGGRSATLYCKTITKCHDVLPLC